MITHTTLQSLSRTSRRRALIHRIGVRSVLGVTILMTAFAASPVLAADGTTAADPATAELVRQAEVVFGTQAGQSFDAHAITRANAAPRTDSMSVIIPAGHGAEIMGEMAAGRSFVFHWTASGEVDVDMHGEAPQAKDEYTSYSIAANQRDASGSLKTTFAGYHGWYWRNRGTKPITVEVTVSGFQTRLFRPDH